MQVSQYFCKGCGFELSDDNWFPSLQTTKQYVCKRCYARGIGKAYCTLCGKASTERRCASCYEERCVRCSVLLTQENWAPSFRKRNVRRCSACHLLVAKNWDARHPGNGAKRQKAWHDRHPERQPAYYRAHKEEYAQRCIDRLWKLKQEVLTRLGGQCVVCGLTDMRLLQINHLNGGGQQEQLFGRDMYQRIASGERGIEDLDVRCANHNLLYEYERGKRRAPLGYSFDGSLGDNPL
jgi:hypothetical protein